MSTEKSSIQFSEEDIVKAAKPCRKLVGVYFLVEGDAVVYVGQTTNLHSRVGSHFATKAFEKYFFIACEADKLDALESHYIAKLDPKHNKMLSSNSGYATLDGLKKRFGLNLTAVKRTIKNNSLVVYANFYYKVSDFESAMGLEPGPLESQEPTVLKLYYDVLNFYELPKINNTNIRSWAKKLEDEVGTTRAKHYLSTLMKRDLRVETFEFRPSLSDSFDVYRKRIKVEEYFVRNKVVAQKTREEREREAAEWEVKRQSQWDD